MNKVKIAEMAEAADVLPNASLEPDALLESQGPDLGVFALLKLSLRLGFSHLLEDLQHLVSCT